MLRLYTAATANGQKAAIALGDYPHIRRWADALARRPAVARGMEAA